LAVALSTIGVWVFHFMVARGIREAAVINRIVTIAKLVPILTFLVFAALMIDRGVFVDNLWGGAEQSPRAIFEQVKSTMLVTVFVFIGVEGASVYSRYAKERAD